MRTILAAITDKHGGHAMGLINPETVLYRKDYYYDEEDDDAYDLVKYNPTLSPGQLRRWRLYENIIERAIDRAKGDPIVLMDLGDQTQGTVYLDDVGNIILADQLVIAKWNLVPWMGIPNVVSVRVVAGTGSHEYGQASAMLVVVEMLKGEFPDKDIIPLYHGLTYIHGRENGAGIDYTHHGPSQSMRKHLEGNNARYYLGSLMQDELMDGNKPPDLVLRGHYHSLINEVRTLYQKRQWWESRLVVVPPLCGFGDFARKITRSAHKVTEGGVVFEIIDDVVSRPDFITETYDIRRKEAINE